MKKLLTFALLAFTMMAGCKKDDPAAPPPAKSVSIAAQQGTLTAGTTGAATFAVTTENIDDGTSGEIEWYTTAAATAKTEAPAGISPSAGGTADNRAVVTIVATEAAQQGDYYFKVTYAATTHAAAAKLTVGASTDKTVQVAAQNGAIESGTAGTATYAVTTTNIAANTEGAVTWYSNAEGTVAAAPPDGITPGETKTGADGKATLTMTASASAKEGAYRFRVSFGTAQSAPATLTVAEPGSKSVLVGDQQGVMAAGFAGKATWNVSTTGIATGIPCTVKWYTTAAGVTERTSPPTGLTATVTDIAAGKTVVTVASTATAVQGDYWFKVLAGETFSAVAKAAVSLSTTKSITVGAQEGTVMKGEAGTVMFPVATTGYGENNHMMGLRGAPAGVRLSPDEMETDIEGKGTFYIRCEANAATGTHSGLQVSVDGIVWSSEFSVTITEYKTTKITFIAPAGTGTVKMKPGESMTFTVDLTPGGIYADNAVKWTSGDYSCATVERSEGVLEMNEQKTNFNTIFIPAGATPGVVVITVKAVNSGASASRIIEVLPAGSGTASDPFLVASAEQLRLVGRGHDGWTLDKHYRQTADIDMAGVTDFWPIGYGYNDAFTGSYDGGGFAIRNLTMSRNGPVGLFGYLSGRVSGVNLVNASISAIGTYSGSAGGIAGNLKEGGTISRCSVQGTVTAPWVNNATHSNTAGGIAGNGAFGSNIFNSSFSGAVSAPWNAGGIMGEGSAAIISCFSGGTVASTGNRQYGHASGGGIVGWQKSSSIYDCYSTADVSGDSGGGIVGWISAGGVVRHCYATGNVTVDWAGGGIAGFVESPAAATNCVALTRELRCAMDNDWNTPGRVTDIVTNSNFGTKVGTLSNNFGRRTMNIIDTRPNGGGWHTVSNSDSHARHDKGHGAPVEAVYYDGANSEYWWGMSASNHGVPGFGSGAWTFRSNALPILKNMPAAIPQNPTVK